MQVFVETQWRSKMFRQFRMRLMIAWKILTNQYCESGSHQCWWLFKREDDPHVMITFDKHTFDNRDCGFDALCTCDWKQK